MSPSSTPSPSDVEALLGALPDAVLTSDTAGNLVFLNRAAERLTGYTCLAVRGRPLAEILPLGNESGRTALESPATACLRTGASMGPLRAKLVDGPGSVRRILEVSAAPIRNPAAAITGSILIARDVTHARQVARRLTHRATHDALTGLVNRAEFEQRLTQVCARALKEGTTHALGFLDLDGFKRINDGAGHLVGDEVLRQVGEVLRRSIRTRDTVARLGGDEFGILLEHCNPSSALRIAENIRKAISDHRFAGQPATCRVGASIGLVPMQGNSGPILEVLRAADAACYEAKHRGGNRVLVWPATGQPVAPLDPSRGPHSTRPQLCGPADSHHGSMIPSWGLAYPLHNE
ncbi:MAG TPA: diguanylate cyclase, partial [Gemmatimonadales bacterium]